MHPSLKIIVFDLGGVIVRICRSWDEACGLAGVPVRAGWDDPAARAERKQLNKLYQEGRIDCGAFFDGIAHTVHGPLVGQAPRVPPPVGRASRLPLYTPDEIRRVHNAWTLAEYPGTGALIDDLYAAGMATGVLSNTNHTHWQRLAPPMHEAAIEYPTPRRVHHLHASHLMQLTKPDEAIYHDFARRSGFKAGTPGTGQGSEILFFDDLEENIAGATQAGWLAQRIDHTGDTVKQMRGVLREFGIL